jgi:hypothetical protein
MSYFPGWRRQRHFCDLTPSAFLMNLRRRSRAKPLAWEWATADWLLSGAAKDCRKGRAIRRCRPTIDKAFAEVIAAFQAHDMTRFYTACAVLHCFALAARSCSR